jgi:hypothetical protein
MQICQVKMYLFIFLTFFVMSNNNLLYHNEFIVPGGCAEVATDLPC